VITVPTTLVLGAGASKPYEFPTGNELAAWLHNPSNLAPLEDTHQLSSRDLQEFCSAFRLSQMSSIDAFLARRAEHSWSIGAPKFGAIGKLAISLLLSKCEKRDRLFISQPDHWYRYLWNSIGNSLDGFAENKLRIITFNYDRSLECYLLTALENSFGIERDRAAEHLHTLPILHVYGKLGELPELKNDGQAACPYGDDKPLSQTRITIGAQSIRVIDEHRDDDEIFSKAHEWLKESERICFIGFGFDPTNVRRLKLRELRALSAKSIRNPEEPQLGRQVGYATTYGMENAERDGVINLLARGRPQFTNHDVVQKNIVPYAEYLPERYLRATGILNDTSS